MTDTQTSNPPDWCCVDCLFWLANGQLPDDTETDLADFTERFNRITAGSEVTLGMLAEYHGCATNVTVTDVAGATYEYKADDDDDARWQHKTGPGTEIAAVVFHDLATVDDCECEQMTFSWSPCATCGSTLGGARDAVTFWPADDTEGN